MSQPQKSKQASRLGMLMGAAALAAAAVATSAAAESSRMSDAQAIERGRYIAKTSGCNDCHTAGYAVSGGKVPEKDWLAGDALGWRGDWGTTYPANLRTYMQTMTETQWVKTAKTLTTRPPMPWFSLHDMTEQDLRAFYRFVRHLGPAGQPAPAYVPPGQTPKGPFIQFPGAPQ
jgi:mono/diheme cytochrome c family protein